MRTLRTVLAIVMVPSIAAAEPTSSVFAETTAGAGIGVSTPFALDLGVRRQAGWWFGGGLTAGLAYRQGAPAASGDPDRLGDAIGVQATGGITVGGATQLGLRLALESVKIGGTSRDRFGAFGLRVRNSGFVAGVDLTASPAADHTIGVQFQVGLDVPPTHAVPLVLMIVSTVLVAGICLATGPDCHDNS